MRYKVYISQVWNYTTNISASNREEANNIAEEIAQIVSPRINNPQRRMRFGDMYVEVEPIKEGREHA